MLISSLSSLERRKLISPHDAGTPVSFLRRNTIRLPTKEEAWQWFKAYQASVDSECRVIEKIPAIEDIQQRPIKSFCYEPLDHTQPSIRLVHLLPVLSPAGLIQCRISHASISSSYVCLSYVWDVPTDHEGSRLPADPNVRVILVNGRPLRIRQNLFEFLRMARHNATRANCDLRRFALSTPFWIDALCIDQSNLGERNHQVKQMGDIYSRAQSVHVWLGTAPSCILDNGNPQSPQRNSVYRSHIEDVLYFWRWATPGESPFRQEDDKYGSALCHFVFSNPYWERAWVVQEFFLARRSTIWIHTYPLSMKSLRQMWDCMNHRGAAYLSTSSASIRAPHYRQFHSNKFGFSLKSSLLEILHQFRLKQCADPRDRIFSLLSLCPDEGSSIVVDYDVPSIRLAYAVLSLQSERVCLCTAAMVSHALIGSIGDNNLTPTHVLDSPWIEVVVPGRIVPGRHSIKMYLSEYVCRSVDFLLEPYSDDQKHQGFEAGITLRIPLHKLPTITDIPRDLCPLWQSNRGLVRMGRGQEQLASIPDAKIRRAGKNSQ